MNAARGRNGEGSLRVPIRITSALLSVWIAVFVSQAPAQTPPTPLATEERSMLERVALAKARADLSSKVAALLLSSDTTLGAWAARDAARERGLRMWLRSTQRAAAPRFYSDGSCEVDVRLNADEIRAQVAALAAHAGSDAPARDALNSSSAAWGTLWGSGMASRAERGKVMKPPGWEDVAPEGIELARQAALADAIEALLERVGGLRITNARRADEFLADGEAVREAVRTELRRLAAVNVELAPDQVAAAEARVSMKELIRALAEVQRTAYTGDLFHAADFREMALLNDANELRATGLATPPGRYLLRGGFKLIELDAPAWTRQTLRAVGRERTSPDASLDEAARVELARLDGVNALRKQVEALVIQGDVTIEQLLAYRPGPKDDIIVFLNGARPSGPPRKQADGSIELPVELPLARLWDIVRRVIPATEVEPAVTQSAPSSASQPADRE
ncbi:MAG: hypothetical protein U1D55_18965 [Phycisphaerae bacterium]